MLLVMVFQHSNRNLTKTEDGTRLWGVAVMVSKGFGTLSYKATEY